MSLNFNFCSHSIATTKIKDLAKPNARYLIEVEVALGLNIKSGKLDWRTWLKTLATIL